MFLVRRAHANDTRPTTTTTIKKTVYVPKVLRKYRNLPPTRDFHAQCSSHVRHVSTFLRQDILPDDRRHRILCWRYRTARNISSLLECQRSEVTSAQPERRCDDSRYEKARNSRKRELVSHVVRDDLIGWVDLSGSERIAAELRVEGVHDETREAREELEDEEAEWRHNDHPTSTHDVITRLKTRNMTSQLAWLRDSPFRLSGSAWVQVGWRRSASTKDLGRRLRSRRWDADADPERSYTQFCEKDK